MLRKNNPSLYPNLSMRMNDEIKIKVGFVIEKDEEDEFFLL
jgi:hypothetical protein